MFQEQDYVILTTDLPEYNLMANDIGRIMRVNEDDTFDLEFLRWNQDTFVATTVSFGQLRSAEPNDVMHSRSLVESTPPKRIDFIVPQMSALQKLNMQFMVKSLNGAVPTDRYAYLLKMNFVRLVEHSIDEYEFARIELEKWNCDPGHYLTLFKATTHLEMCIFTMKRALKHLGEIEIQSATSDWYIKEITGTLQTSLADMKDPIQKMRNEIVHVEERIIEGRIRENQAAALVPGKEAIEIGPLSMRYSEIADWLTVLHQIAVKVVDSL